MFFKSVSILNVLVFCLAVLITHSVHAQKKVSVSDKEVNQSKNIFRFAIMGDRTGGMRPGIFARAAEKVNIMQPEFILSVGDLVDGYTTEPEVWNAQWEEFDAIINKMDMPFYYVPGNHDISNDLLRDVWVKRHGSPYYTFVYKNVLFVSLHTEDRKGGGISEEQVAYINEQLEMHNDVRWTLFFMHRPIWSYGDQAGFEEIEASLKGRNYTLFSGHHHHYEYQKRNGMDHYILATTGGGSNLRGVEFGEFDHITWVTMKDNGPVVAHIEFDHIYDKDIVTTENKPMVQALRMGEWLKTSAIIVETSSVNTTQIPITLSNPVEHPIVVNGSLKDSLITFSPSDFELTIPANTDTTFSLAANWDEHISLHDLNEYAVQIILQGTYKQENEKELSLPAKKRLVFDHPHDLEIIQKDITIDANLDDWNDLPFKNITNPVYMHEDWDWNGKEDGTLTFATQMDDKYIYVALKSDDDKLILENELGERQDKFFIRLNPFSAKNRKTEYPNRLFGFEQVADTLHYQIDIAQGKTIQKPNIQTNSEKVKVEAAMKSNRETGEQILEIAIPLSVVEDIQGKNWTSIRLNFGWMDHDRPENTKPSVLWWRPVWGSAQDDPGMGIFLKSQE